MRSAAMKLTLMTTILASAVSSLAACSSDDTSIPPATDAGAADASADATTDGAMADAAHDAAPTVDAAANDGGTEAGATKTLADVGHVIVFYMENHSFDNLYGDLAGAEGRAASGANIPQIDGTGTAYPTLPTPTNQSPETAAQLIPTSSLPNAFFDITKYVPEDQILRDLVHRYYQEQAQINGGAMNKFTLWSDAEGISNGYYPTASLPMAQYIASIPSDVTVCDHFFHAAFGGSFLNHIWLVSAASPVFTDAPASMKAHAPGAGETANIVDATGAPLVDGAVTPDGYVVNTSYTVNTPHPLTAPAATNTLVPNQVMPTIGDRLTAKNVDWAWYSGGWNDALAGKFSTPVDGGAPLNPDQFQFHHQPFAYFASFADGTAAKAAHLKDETDFTAAVAAGTLPAVSFIKPIGINNEHSGYAAVASSENHLVDLIKQVRASAVYKDAVIVVTYDENGGFFDHVAPPAGAAAGAKADKWGPGSRVPGIVISPFAKGGIDKTNYDTTAILKLIEKRWGLDALGTRDAAQNDMSAGSLKLTN